ncbi:MAG: type I DNA topoisomerase [Clostridia bacterium]|nr:type I DNA topoisomerase [Clostridia bacterium]
MAKLVIVESPAKAKSIGKYLGRGYEVVASMGHLRDLPKSTLGVDVDNDFQPRYIPIRGKDKTIKEIKAKVAKASHVYLATDPDREGEAISWHLAALLNLDLTEKNRVTFNEITKNAVTAGIKNTRTVDLNLVDAYQARRVLDRIVGYKLSPLLWKKVKKGLSAGRVQSVVTKLVVDRENEIRAFVPEEYWTIDMICAPAEAPNREFVAHYFGTIAAGKKEEVHSKDEADAILAAAETSTPKLLAQRKKDRLRNPSPPFITSTLQQEASRRFSFGSKKTMKLAQDLYEGQNISGLGLTGLITYMRTDSLRLSDEITEAARTYIPERFGNDYVPSAKRVFKTNKNAQDAHEAIRPTHVELTPEAVKADLPTDHWKLYKLIWERFIACQMSAAIYDTVALDIGVADYLFRANGNTLKFAGFTALYEDTVEEKDNEEAEGALPKLADDEALVKKSVTPNQKFTQPPPRYTEASLIRAMEEKNIGRPSTYSPTISTITDREYVARDGKALYPTQLGEVVTGLMVDKFADIMDVGFSANMEESLDGIGEGKTEWKGVIRTFYQGFADELAKAEKDLEGVDMKVPDPVTDVICENCGRNMVVKSGRFGKFLACPGYPECKFTKPLAQETPGICPKCGNKILERKSKNGNKYYACEKNPACGFMTWDKPLAELCPKCGKPLYRRYTREEKKIYCAIAPCDYEREYRPRGKARQTESGAPEEANL